ncbi:unnamed protein product [Bursaphelenchus okinawaensis]|uniref:Uncharacterized protein n=1 Tax=Bursaphelenchus okinawaensis TaxID=465554 RepID=A0A811KQV9_9BILA|nr:unnamed protein product [Bursaphelenchus okinawaensis]CAG9110971.1 unnamed protein product [Bursaphelenchus okinawaensis]
MAIQPRGAKTKMKLGHESIMDSRKSLPQIKIQHDGSITETFQSMFKQKLGSIIQDGIAEGQRFALYSNLSQNSVISPKCDIVVALKSREQELAKIQCVWLVDVLKRLEPQFKVEVRYHTLTNCYALYITATYVSLLKGLSYVT